MLEADGRRCVVLAQTRRRPGELVDDYGHRIAEALREAQVELAWIAVPPGEHVPLLVRAALAAGVHVIVEKPWPYPAEQTRAVLAARQAASRLVAVDYQYCLLDAVGHWRARYGETAGLMFGGAFVVATDNRLGISAMDNLGSHLLAIREHAVPGAAVGEIRCGYGGSPERRVWLDGPDGGRLAEIDFGANSEPILQRFAATVESAAGESAAGSGELASFPFDLGFAQRVADAATEVTARPAG